MPLETTPTSEPPRPDRWEPLTAELHALRRSAGDPSFAEIARRISEQRTRAGASEHAARVARSTVHDSFRVGRSRINRPLLGEIAAALGADPSVVDAWIARCHQDLPAPADPGAGPADRAGEAAAPRPVGAAHVALLLLGCLAVNLLGREFVDFLRLPIYLDMVGTAVAAIALGPWRGAAVGALTNLVGVVGSGAVSLPFLLVNVVGALVWGYGVRWGLGRTLPRFLGLDLLVAVACTTVAVPLLAAVVPPDALRGGHDAITRLVQESVDGTYPALALSNLLTSMTDKLVSGFLALAVVSALPLALRGNLDFLRTGEDRG